MMIMIFNEIYIKMKCKMKKMINKSFWFCFVMLFFACNAMDNPPTDKYTDNNFWTSIDKA